MLMSSKAISEVQEIIKAGDGKNVTDFGKPFFETLEKEKERIREGGCIVTITFDMIGDLYDLASAGLAYSGDTSLSY